MEAEFKLLLQNRFDESKEVEKALSHLFGARMEGFSESTTEDFDISPETGVKDDYCCSKKVIQYTRGKTTFQKVDVYYLIVKRWLKTLIK